MSVIVPARDESQHIGACVQALLASTYPALQVIVVDDHSSDGTGALAREAGAGDGRLVVTTPPPLPAGWLGKQWACQHGAGMATGTILLFTDADVRHAPELHGRIARELARVSADLLSVAGHQETVSFWERVAQPFVFAVLALRYGGPASVNRSRRAHNKIANGQCLAFRREAYDAFGGHAAVRGKAAEDLAFAQEMFSAGYRTWLVLGVHQLSTRMYGSLREIVAGWGKNVYAAGRETLPGGRVAGALAPLLVPFPALWSLAPVVALLLMAAGVLSPALLVPAGIATGVQLVWFGAIVHRFRIPLPYALLFPLGALVFLQIALGAVWRGGRVEWKGRHYDVGANRPGLPRA